MREIPLTRGLVAIVDDDRYEELARHKWHAQWSPHTRSFYARRGIWVDGKVKILAMHRVIMCAQPGQEVDHVHTGDTLNNQRENLRFCTNSQNQYNKRPQRGGTSAFKGVSFHKHHGKWQARITFNGRTYQIGSFLDERAAAMAYDRRARELFGTFALPNSP